MTWILIGGLLIGYLVWRELARIRKALEGGRPAATQTVDAVPEVKTDMYRFCESRSRRIGLAIREAEAGATIYVTCAREADSCVDLKVAHNRPDVSIVVDPDRSPMPSVVADYADWIRLEAEKKAQSPNETKGTK